MPYREVELTTILTLTPTGHGLISETNRNQSLRTCTLVLLSRTPVVLLLAALKEVLYAIYLLVTLINSSAMATLKQKLFDAKEG